jgi:hypothetical protein
MRKAHQEATKDSAWTEQHEEDAKGRARLLMEASIEFSTSRQEYGQQLAAWPFDLIYDYLEILEGALRSFERKTSG